MAAFATWKGHIKAGTTIGEPLHIVDLYPTLLKLAGGKAERGLPVDGLDIWPTLKQGRPSPHNSILLNTTPSTGAIRAGEWKLVVKNGNDDPDGGIAKNADRKRVELFNLKEDPYEQENLADKHPEQVTALESQLKDFARQAVAPKSKPRPKNFVAPRIWGE